MIKLQDNVKAAVNQVGQEARAIRVGFFNFFILSMEGIAYKSNNIYTFQSNNSDNWVFVE